MVGCATSASRCGLVLLVVSVLFALLCALTRLWDFKETAEIARLKEKLGNHPKSEECEEILALRGDTTKLGERTWCLLYFQLSTFTFGAVLLGGAFFPW